jgi:nitrile hydratase
MTARFAIGDTVRIADRYPPGHIRTPYYIRGKRGVIADVLGAFPNPEERARARDGLPELPLYRVRFRQTEAWPDYDGDPGDTLDMEIYQHWLEPEPPAGRGG